MNWVSKLALIVLILVMCVACDQVTKGAAKANLPAYPPLVYLDGFVQMQYTENPGAMMGLGAQLPVYVRTLILVGLNGLFLVGIMWFIWRTPDLPWWVVVGGALIVAGGLGNLLDRLLYGGVVVDFVHIGFGRLRTGVFNLADVAIMAGAGLLLLWGWRERGSHDEVEA